MRVKICFYAKLCTQNNILVSKMQQLKQQDFRFRTSYLEKVDCSHLYCTQSSLIAGILFSILCSRVSNLYNEACGTFNNQSTNHSILNQAINKRSNQSINQSIIQSFNQSINQSINQKKCYIRPENTSRDITNLRTKKKTWRNWCKSSHYNTAQHHNGSLKVIRKFFKISQSGSTTFADRWANVRKEGILQRSEGELQQVPAYKKTPCIRNRSRFLHKRLPL